MKLMKEQKRKQLAFRVPQELADLYEKTAMQEGYGTLSGWIISVLGERLLRVNNLPTGSQQERKVS